MPDAFIIAATWFALGFSIAAIIFVTRMDRQREDLLKHTKTLLERNEELISQNKRLISFNNKIVASIKEIRKTTEHISDLLR